MMLRPLMGTFGEHGRLGAGGDHDVFGAVSLLLCGVGHPDRVRIDKARDPANEFDVVARQLRLDDIHFGLDHVLDAESQIRHGDLFFDAIVHAIDVLVVIAGQMQHGLAKGLAGNGAGVDADAAHHFATLHQSHAFAHFRALDGRALPRRTGADDDQIVGLHRGTNLTHEASRTHESRITIGCQSCQNGRY